MSEQGRRIGVFVCHCGGNIGDYVDVKRVAEEISKEPGVVVSKDHMFTCSDAAQQDMSEDIVSEKLDGLVIASCSPKLHMFTFRGMAERAGLNPYRYVHVNLREQCSWAHTDKPREATDKAIELVRAGVAKCALTRELSPLRVETTPGVVVVGGGVAGMQAALALSDLGQNVYLVERSSELGGWTGRWRSVFPDDSDGRALIDELRTELGKRENITVFTDAEVTGKSGNLGDFQVTVAVQNKGREETLALHVGAIVIATGFESYSPAQDEYGFGAPGVVTLDAFKQLVDESVDVLEYKGRPVTSISYIYCTGSRQKKSETRPNPHTYCSRYCCTAAVHTAASLSAKFPAVRQYHLFRDMRTYGGNELLYEDARDKGSIFIRYEADSPPEVVREDDHLLVKVRDGLTGNRELEIANDLVVLVTAMVPRRNEKLIEALKVPLDKDGFFKEIHVKLRPVETVIDGVFIAGTSQGPRTIPESVESSLSAVSKAGAMLLKGYVDLEPLVAGVRNERCSWCDECSKVCPYNAVQQINCDGREIAAVIPSLCKGCGACVPVCPRDALEVEGYTDAQVVSMIEAFSREVGHG